MIGKTLRRINLAGKAYAKGDRIELPDDQFVTFEQCGMVQRNAPRPAKKIAV